MLAGGADTLKIRTQWSAGSSAAKTLATMAVAVAVPGARVYEYSHPDREGRSPGVQMTVKAR